jgi:drug/metabolite transporter (DMT)-like permease
VSARGSSRSGPGALRPFLPELALVGAAVLYGCTFKIVQDGLRDVSAIGFILVRFAMASALLAPFALRRNAKVLARPGPGRRALVVACLAFGVAGFLGYAFQNAGLERTTTSNSAFITGLYVVFAPLSETIVGRHRPPLNVVVAIGGSVLGLFLLTGARLHLGAGDALTLGCAACFGWWIYLGGRYAGRFDPLMLAFGQMVVYVVLAAPAVAVVGLGHLTGRALLACGATAVFGSALAFWFQLWGQQRVEPSRAAVLLLFEPVVAGVVGYVIGERIGVSGVVGALVILAAMLLAEAHAWRRSVGSSRPAARKAA